MKCGHGHEHSSVAEVKACYQVERTAVPEQVVHGGPTPNQRTFISSLLDQVGRDESSLPKPMATLTVEEASEVISGLIDVKRNLPNTAQVMSASSKPNVTGKHLVQQGTYTVVFPESDDHVTLRFRIPKMGKWSGVQLVEYLYGPDNTSDYRRFANQAGQGYRIWMQYQDNKRLEDALTHMMTADPEATIAAGEVYALKSNNCWRCNRTLTREDSITRGMGAKCAGIVLGGTLV